MPPPGIPDWVFPGAVVANRTGALQFQYVISSLELGNNIYEITVYLQRISAGEGHRLLNDDEMDSETMSLPELLSGYQHIGEYLQPPSPLSPAITTLTGADISVGSVVEITEADGRRDAYVVTGRQAEGNNLVRIGLAIPEPPQGDNISVDFMPVNGEMVPVMQGEEIPSNLPQVEDNPLVHPELVLGSHWRVNNGDDLWVLLAVDRPISFGQEDTICTIQRVGHTERMRVTQENLFRSWHRVAFIPPPTNPPFVTRGTPNRLARQGEEKFLVRRTAYEHILADELGDDSK